MPNSSIEVLGGDGDVSAEYTLTRGVVHDLYPHRFHADTDSLILTQEFGTLPGVLVARALVLENMAHQHIPDAAARSPWTQFTKGRVRVRVRELSTTYPP